MLLERMRGGLYGFAVGDLLEWPADACGQSAARMRQEPGGCAAPCAAPADASLTLAAMDSLCGGFDMQDLVRRFSPGWQPGAHSALPRVLPLAFFLFPSVGTEVARSPCAMERIHAVSALTSARPESLVACGLYVCIACGLLGALHNRGMFLCQDLFGRIRTHLPYARLAAPFALAGAAAFVWPELMCGGDAIIEQVLGPAAPGLATLLALLAGKYVFTAVCFGSGAPGGTLFPLVVLGALVGGIFASACGGLVGLEPWFFSNFVALGVAGLFSGVVRAPVTAVVLVFELTGSLDALLSVSIVSIVISIVYRSQR